MTERGYEFGILSPDENHKLVFVSFAQYMQGFNYSSLKHKDVYVGLQSNAETTVSFRRLNEFVQLLAMAWFSPADDIQIQIGQHPECEYPVYRFMKNIHVPIA